MRNKILFFLLSTSAWAAVLPVQDFVSEFKETNFGYKSSAVKSQAFQSRNREGHLLYSPLLSAEAGKQMDKRETTVPSFNGNRTDAVAYNMSLSQNTPWGIKGKLGYSVNHVMVAGATQLNPDNYYLTSPFAEVSISLMRNLLGSEVKSQVAAKSESNRALAFEAQLQERLKLFGAEQSYWRLALAREVLKVQKGVLERSEKLLNWATRRAALQLGEKSDMLQAKAAVEIRRIDLESAKEEERSAIRGISESLNREFSDETEWPSISKMIELKEIPQLENRLDIAAASAQERAIYANAQLVREQVKPSFDLYGSYSRNGKDRDYSASISESLASQHPVATVGVKLSVPLSFGLVNDVSQGVRKEQESALLDLRKRESEAALDWQDLSARFAEAKLRLKLADQVVQIQKEKSEHERDRLMKGRSTTYQVLLFDQDYSQALLLRLRTGAEVLRLYSQLKIHGDQEW